MFNIYLQRLTVKDQDLKKLRTKIQKYVYCDGSRKWTIKAPGYNDEPQSHTVSSD